LLPWLEVRPPLPSKRGSARLRYASANSRGAWCASFRNGSYRRRTRNSRCAPALSPAAFDAAAAVAVAAAAAAVAAAAAAAGAGAGAGGVSGISFHGIAVSRTFCLCQRGASRSASTRSCPACTFARDQKPRPFQKASGANHCEAVAADVAAAAAGAVAGTGAGARGVRGNSIRPSASRASREESLGSMARDQQQQQQQQQAHQQHIRSNDGSRPFYAHSAATIVTVFAVVLHPFWVRVCRVPRGWPQRSRPGAVLELRGACEPRKCVGIGVGTASSGWGRSVPAARATARRRRCGKPASAGWLEQHAVFANPSRLWEAIANSNARKPHG
jgi:hypothetical protein